MCEALDPGPRPKPLPPTTLESIFLIGFPELTLCPVPDDESCPQPSVLIPPIRECPKIRSHAIDFCAQTGTYGGIPSDPLDLVIRQTDETIEEVVVVHQAKAKKKWTLPDSIFAPRTKEADCKSFEETSKVMDRALEADWARLCKEARFAKFIAKNDYEIQSTGQALDGEMGEVKDVFREHYPTILRMYDFYCAVGSSVGKAAFAIGKIAYTQLLDECQLCDPKCCSTEEAEPCSAMAV